MTTHLPGRPVISEACRQRIAELIADWPPLSGEQRAVIGREIRAGRRLHRTTEQRGSAAA
jgi:hypothetical protein